MKTPDFSPFIVFLHLATFALTAHLPTLSAQNLATIQQNLSDLSNKAVGLQVLSDRENGNIINGQSNYLHQCRLGNFRLHYRHVGDEVKPGAFDAVIRESFIRFQQAGQLYGWDTQIVIASVQVRKHDYWLSFYGRGLPQQPTWRKLMELLTLVEYCYVKGYNEEFAGTIYEGTHTVSYCKLEFFRPPEQS